MLQSLINSNKATFTVLTFLRRQRTLDFVSLCAQTEFDKL